MVESFLSRYKNSKCSQHDFKHIQNVISNSIEIAKRIDNKEIDLNLVRDIAIFHDITYLYYKSSVFTYLGEPFFVKKLLQKELNNYTFTEENKKILLDACISHPHSFPFRKLNRNKSVYAQILQDADTIDSFDSKRVKKFNKKAPILSKVTDSFVEYARRNLGKYLNLNESKGFFLEKMNEDFCKVKIYNEKLKNTVVLLHGYADDISKWEKYIQTHSNERIVAVNFPMNMKYQDKIFSIRELAEYVVEVLNSKDIKEFHLKGFSLGGLVAVEVASLLKNRVLSLSLLSSYPRLFNSNFLQGIYPILKPFLLSDFFVYTYSRLNTNWIVRYFAHSPKISKTVMKRMKENRKTLMGTLFNIVAWDGVQKYKELSIPKIIFVSLDDTVLKYQSVSRMAELDDIELTVIKGGGHGESEEYYDLCSFMN